MVTIQQIDLIRSMARITLDQGGQYWLTRSDLLACGWVEGASVEWADFEKNIELCQYPRGLNQAVAMLARRPCSKGEIMSSLRRHHYADSVIDLVLYKLEKEKLLSDEEFSGLWVQSRSRKMGPRRIRYELMNKGVDPETIDEALAQIDEDETLASAKALAEKAWHGIKPGEDPRKSRQKIIASLVRKGFDWDTAKKAVDETAEND